MFWIPMLQLFYKKGIEMLEKRWDECITLEGDYVDEWRWILPKSCCFISHPTNLLSDVLVPFWPTLVWYYPLTTNLIPVIGRLSRKFFLKNGLQNQP